MHIACSVLRLISEERKLPESDVPRAEVVRLLMQLMTAKAKPLQQVSLGGRSNKTPRWIVSFRCVCLSSCPCLC